MKLSLNGIATAASLEPKLVSLLCQAAEGVKVLGDHLDQLRTAGHLKPARTRLF